MLIFSKSVISLLLAVTALTARPHPGVITVHVPQKALDIPVSQFDDRFGNMVAEVPCIVPYTFIQGTIAQASQVNANFTALATCLNTIYASDIIPTSAAQATFGGSLQYTFPAGVAVGGGQNNPFTTSGGSVWLTETGSLTASYAINLGMQNCGNTGSFALWNVGQGATLLNVDCTNGTLTNKAGSIFAGAITANNGNFIAGSGAVELCPNGSCAGLVPTFATNGITTLPGPVLAIPTGAPGFAPTPAPVAGICYLANGNPCSNAIHTVYVTGLNPTTNGSCTANTACAINGTVSVNLAGNAQFAAPDGAWDIDCAAFSPSGVIVTVGWVTGSPQTIQVLTLYNATGGAITGGTGYHIGASCTGT